MMGVWRGSGARRGDRGGKVHGGRVVGCVGMLCKVEGSEEE